MEGEKQPIYKGRAALRKQEIDAYEQFLVFNVIGNMVFWTLMILVGFILGLIWAAAGNK